MSAEQGPTRSTRLASRLTQFIGQYAPRGWRALLVWSALLACITGGIGIAGGIWFEMHHGIERFQTFISGMRNEVGDDVVTWNHISSHYHQLEIATIPLPASTINGGSLAEVNGHILIASPQGRFIYLDSQRRLRALNMNTRMNIEGLRNHPLYDDARFSVASLRTLDLLTIPTSDGQYDLYASYDRFAGDCIEFVVGRHRLQVTTDAIVPVGSWVEVWKATPCLRFRDRGSLLEGTQQGGRLVRNGQDTILISVGDYQHDGFYDSTTVSMDPETDFGKLVELNIRTGASRHVAMGLRNPQGLAIDRIGRIWETEHGPQGGDEINLLQEGGNYGWPIVTYGMLYGTPPASWPANPRVGRHDGYERPRYAFVPSIGISNIIEPDPQHFPNWEDSLLVGSLVRETLFVVKRHGDDIVVVEPIVLGRRLRDIISLSDGSLAILVDNGALLLMRNAVSAHDAERHFTVVGRRDLPRPSIEESPPSHLTEAQKGRALFASACASCHSIRGEVGIGPPLNGIVGRRIASAEGFGYSNALAEQGGTWEPARLADYIHNPSSIVPGTVMVPTGLHDKESWYVVQYLRTLRASESRARSPAN